MMRCRRPGRRAGCTRRSRSRRCCRLDVALVDPLLADRPLDLDDAVVEVDEHRPVGDDALSPIGTCGRRRSCTPGRSPSWPRSHLALVQRILEPSPIQAQRPKRPSRGGRSRVSGRGQKKQMPSVCGARRAQLQQRVAREQARVAAVEHVVGAHEAEPARAAAAQRREAGSRRARIAGRRAERSSEGSATRLPSRRES